jgi:thiamine pyrophosphokinase
VRAVVFLDGEYADPAWHRALTGTADLVLAADGGARYLAEIGVTPGAVVGDFDSLDVAGVRRLEAAGVELVRHPVRKDFTDGESAVEEALRRGASEVVLAGGTGALDHTLGHLAILRRLSARGVLASLVAPGLSVIVLTGPAGVGLCAPVRTRVSLVSLAGDAVVTLQGLDYPLDHGVLPADACLGIGNSVCCSAGATVTVHAGVAALLVEADEPVCPPVKPADER